jgi:hypothetical protein
MNPAILMYAMQALEAIPSLISAGQSVIGLVNQTSSAVKQMVDEKRDPTAEEWAAQAKVISDLRAILHAA